MAKSASESKADKSADVKRVASGVHQHERAMHPGKGTTKLKLNGRDGASGKKSK